MARKKAPKKLVRPGDPWYTFGRPRELDWDEVAALLKAGMTQTEIAEKVGATQGAISQIAIKLQVGRRHRGNSAVPAAWVEKWAERYRAGEGLKAIAKRSGVHYETVRRRLKQIGVEMRRQPPQLSQPAMSPAPPPE